MNPPTPRKEPEPESLGFSSFSSEDVLPNSTTIQPWYYDAAGEMVAIFLTQITQIISSIG
jgi:hypothetical protein